MGLPPDRPPTAEDLAWLEALAGHADPTLDPALREEAALLAAAIRAEMQPPTIRYQRPRPSSKPADGAGDLSEFSAMAERIVASQIPPKLSNSASISMKMSSYEPPSPGPSANGFARLLGRLKSKGLL